MGNLHSNLVIHWANGCTISPHSRFRIAWSFLNNRNVMACGYSKDYQGSLFADRYAFFKIIHRSDGDWLARINAHKFDRLGRTSIASGGRQYDLLPVLHDLFMPV